MPMTMEAYKRATAILEEKKQLEEKLYQLRMSVNFQFDTEESIEISNKLFALGQEFAAL